MIGLETLSGKSNELLSVTIFMVLRLESYRHVASAALGQVQLKLFTNLWRHLILKVSLRTRRRIPRM